MTSRKIFPVLEILKSLSNISGVPYNLYFIVSDFTFFLRAVVFSMVQVGQCPLKVQICVVPLFIFHVLHDKPPDSYIMPNTLCVCTRLMLKVFGRNELKYGKSVPQKAKSSTDSSGAQPCCSASPTLTICRVESTLCMVKAHTCPTPSFKGLN